MEQEREERDLLRDERGAIMVMGVFMAVLLVGMIYYVSGIGETILYRERMQDASDAGAFGAAVMHARGMNILALLNMIMAAVLAVLVALKVIHFILAAATIVASGICAACLAGGSGCWACPIAVALEIGREEVSGVIESVEPPIQNIVSIAHGVSVGVREGYPIAAQAKVIEYGAYTYDPPTTAGFIYPFIDSLPTEDDDSDLLCRKAGEQAPTFVVPFFLVRLARRVLSPSVGGLAATFSSYFCGEGRDKAQRVLEDAELGDENFQVRAFMIGDPPFARAEQGVAVAAWGQEDRSAIVDGLRELGRVSFSQAEFYYADGRADRREWMWHMDWRARLRRFEMPGDMSGIGAMCGSGCSGLGALTGVREVVVH